MRDDSPLREAKRRLRAELRAERRALPKELLAQRAGALAERAREGDLHATAPAVAGYVAEDGELDVAPVLEACRGRGARIFLPRTGAGRALELVEVGPAAGLRPSGPGGVAEPVGPAAARLPRGGVALVPAVALDAAGARLGRGGGYYDRLLPRLRHYGWAIVGVCHAEHLRPELPAEAHDAPVDWILTERGWRRPRPAADGVVLCGGRSRRMGTPKPAVRVAGMPMLARVVAALLHSCPTVWLVAPPTRAAPDVDWLALACGGLPAAAPRLRLLRDATPYAGPAAALAAALAAVETELVFAAACDTPLLKPALVEALLERAATEGVDLALVLRDGKPEPLGAAYRREPTAALLAASLRRGERSLRAAIAPARAAVLAGRELAAVDPEGRSLWNVNTLAERAEAERLLDRSRLREPPEADPRRSPRGSSAGG